MQSIPKWRNVLQFKNSLIHPTSPSSSFYWASIHSTPTSSEKWKKKWEPDSNGQQPSKTYIRYETRQKRADAKKALKNLLFHSGSVKTTFQGVHKTEHSNMWGQDQRDHSNSSNKKGRSKSSARACKAHHKKKKHQSSRDSSFEDFDEYPESFFQATFGGKCYTWSFRSWGDPSSQSSSSEFEWREHLNWNSSSRKSYTEHRTESDWESSSVGSCSDRTILGLPLAGPLKIEDVKTAFRLAALKWHPDKHQGPSQAMAEERFKHCVNAYKSLCSTLASG